MSSEKKARIKIAAVIPTLEKGGAERVLVHLVNHIDHSRFDVSILCLKKKGELVAQVDSRVQVVDVNFPRVYFSIFRLRRAIKKMKADVVIGWLGNVNAVLAFFKPFLPKGITLLCRESSIPSLFNRFYRLPFLFNFFYRFYNRFDGIITQSDAMKNDLVINFGVDVARIKTIYNPVVMTAAETPAFSEGINEFFSTAKKILLFVGRFSSEKNAGLLVDVMELLPADYRLLLIGYGPQQDEVQKKIKAAGREKQIMILDNCTFPAPYYKRADCFILASLFEGFPNVLLEANAQGCPVVVYKTKGGAKEIITNENGLYIEPDDKNGLNEFADAIMQVCTNKPCYNAEIIKQQVKDRYDAAMITETYMNYITAVTKKKKS